MKNSCCEGCFHYYTAVRIAAENAIEDGKHGVRFHSGGHASFQGFKSQA